MWARTPGSLASACAGAREDTGVWPAGSVRQRDAEPHDRERGDERANTGLRRRRARCGYDARRAGQEPVRSMGRGSLRIGLALAALLAAGAPACARAASGDPYHATVRRTTHGIPHVLASDWGGLGYGYGYAFAQDNLCQIADSYVTVNGERSKYFGPDASWSFRSNSTTPNNLNSDIF